MEAEAYIMSFKSLNPRSDQGLASPLSIHTCILSSTPVNYENNLLHH